MSKVAKPLKADVGFVQGCGLRRSLLPVQPRRIGEAFTLQQRRPFLTRRPPPLYLLHCRRHINIRIPRRTQQQPRGIVIFMFFREYNFPLREILEIFIFCHVMGTGKSWKSFLILEIVFPQRGNILVLPLREILEILEIFILCHWMGSGKSWKSWKSLFSVIGWVRANLGNFFSILEIVFPQRGNILVLPLREILEILEIFILCHWMGTGKSWKSFFNLGNRIPASGNILVLPLREILEIMEIFILCHRMGSGESWKFFFNLGNSIPASGNCVRLESLRFDFVFSLKLKV